MVLIKKRNFRPYILNWLNNKLGLGLGIGNIRYMATSGGEFESNLLDNGVPTSEIYTTVLAAEDDLTSAKNDVLLITPGVYSATPAMTWDKSNCHVLGLSPDVVGYNPCYFTHTADQDVWWTVSGANNTFHNIRWQHGGSSVTNAHCMELTGSSNRFYYCHFDGPETTAEAATANYDLVKISEEYQNFFKCLFGNPWNAMTDVSALLGFTGNKNATSFFEDCIFQKNCGNTTNLFIHTYQSLNGGSHIHFNNCTFQNLGTSTPQYAIDGYGLNTNNAMITLHNSDFCGVTDIVAATYESYVWFTGGSVFRTSALANGLGINPDVS